MFVLEKELSDKKIVVNSVEEEAVVDAFQILNEALVEMKNSSKIDEEEFIYVSDLVRSTFHRKKWQVFMDKKFQKVLSSIFYVLESAMTEEDIDKSETSYSSLFYFNNKKKVINYEQKS